jgi:hypothetical protein
MSRPRPSDASFHRQTLFELFEPVFDDDQPRCFGGRGPLDHHETLPVERHVEGPAVGSRSLDWLVGAT